MSGWGGWKYALLGVLVAGQATAAGLSILRPDGFRPDGSLSSLLPAPASMPAPGQEPRPLDVPVRVEIPALGLSAPVDPVGLNPDRTMEVPVDFARLGWYTGLEAPGEKGTAVIVGHFDSKSGPAVFYKLKQVSHGDEIKVTLASGRSESFVVEREEQYPKDRFPGIDVYAPSSKVSLRLITCDGVFDRRERHYKDNLVVFASARAQ